jgi:hypothetical protein
MEKAVNIYNKNTVSNDCAYWMSKTPAERLNAIEFLRSQYPDYENLLTGALQRVCTIIRKK